MTHDTHAALTLEEELQFFAGDSVEVLHFPDWETLPYDLFPPHPEIVSRRIAALYRLPSLKRGVLVVPVATLMQRLAPRSFIGGSSLQLALRQKLDLQEEQRRLQAAGYRAVPQVGEPGEFAVRGSLLDIFPMGSSEPYRIELFDREIESIRSFDPETQRSLHKIEKVDLLPAREFPLTEESIKAFRNTVARTFPDRSAPLPDLPGPEGRRDAGRHRILPADVLRSHRNAVRLSRRRYAVRHHRKRARARPTRSGNRRTRATTIARTTSSGRSCRSVELYLPPQQLREQLNQRLRVEMVAAGTNEHAVDLGAQPAPVLSAQKREAPFDELKRFAEKYDGKVLIATDSAGRREALIEQLDQHGIKSHVASTWKQFVDESATTNIADDRRAARRRFRARPRPR